MAMNWDKSVASFCRPEAASGPDMLLNFYQTKNHKFANNLTTAKIRQKKAQISNP